MMKKLILFMVTLLCAATLARDLPRVAVYVAGDVADNEKSALGTRMLAALVNSGRYMGIERSDAFLAEVEKEHVKQRSGAIDDGQISELGRQFGVRHICIAAITPAFGAFLVSARIIDVETAQVIHIGESNSPLKNMADFTWVSDEVVHVMFGGEPRPRPAAKSKIGISMGVGGLFSSDFGGGSEIVAMPYTGGGAYLFVDTKYGQITAAFSTGGGMWVGIVNAEIEMRRSFVCAGAYAKYPEIALGASEKIKIFPLLGVDYEADVGSELLAKGSSVKLPKVGELSALWGKIGGGLDLNLNADVHLRAEVMYGARTSNAYERDYGQARLGHGVTARAGAGIRF